MANKKSKSRVPLTSTLITLLIVVMLIISGPASAVIVSISGLSGSTVTKGGSKTFDITITLQNPDKFVPISNITLNLNGPTPRQWTFNPVSGAIISGGSDISINVVSYPNSNYYGQGFGYGVGNGTGYNFGNVYGYGYDFGQGGGSVSFTYQITLSTTNLVAGSYTATAYLNTGSSIKPNFASTSASFTVAPPDDGGDDGGVGGGGGGGGGGGTSGENFTNIEIKEKHDLYIFKDKTTPYIFNSTHPIISVNITGNNNAGEINVAVEVLRNTSALVKSKAPGIVYKNVNIWVGTSGFATPKNIKEAGIRFRVENSWLGSNNLKGSDIRMTRWNGSEWTQLETTGETKDDIYSYYNAKTDRFSPFAVVGLKGEATPVETLIPAETTPAPIRTSNPEAVPTGKEGGFRGILTVIAVVLVIIVAALAVIYFKKKKG